MIKRDNGRRGEGSKHSAMNALRRGQRSASALTDGDRTGPARATVADAADAAEDDYARFLHRGR